MTATGEQLTEKEEGVGAEAKGIGTFLFLHPLDPSPLEACTVAETESGQKKPLEMNCSQTGSHGGVIDTGACRCNETDAGFSAPVIY